MRITECMQLCGYPGDGAANSICVSTGWVMQFHEGLIVLSNYQMRGSSGGPAVSTTGRVVGVLSKGSTGAAHLVKINSIKPMLEMARHTVSNGSASATDLLNTCID